MTGIVGLFVCPLLCLYSSSDARLHCAVWLDILGVAVLSQSIYVLRLLGLHLKCKPHGNFQAIREVNRTSHRYHFVPLYLAGWFRGK